MGLLQSQSNGATIQDTLWLAREFFLEPGVIRQSQHGLRVGDRDGYYFDIDYLLNDPVRCQQITEIYADKIRRIDAENSVDLLAFIEKDVGGTIGALRLAAAMSIATSIPNIVVRPRKAISFERVKLPLLPHGDIGIKRKLGGRNAVIVTDHCTTGGEVILTKKILESLQAKVTHAVTYTMRSDKFNYQLFNDEGISIVTSYSIPHINGIPKTLAEIGQIAINE